MYAGQGGTRVLAELRVVVHAYDGQLGRNRDLQPSSDVEYVCGGVVVLGGAAVAVIFIIKKKSAKAFETEQAE